MATVTGHKNSVDTLVDCFDRLNLVSKTPSVDRKGTLHGTMDEFATLKARFNALNLVYAWVNPHRPCQQPPRNNLTHISSRRRILEESDESVDVLTMSSPVARTSTIASVISKVEKGNLSTKSGIHSVKSVRRRVLVESDDSDGSSAIVITRPRRRQTQTMDDNSTEQSVHAASDMKFLLYRRRNSDGSHTSSEVSIRNRNHRKPSVGQRNRSSVDSSGSDWDKDNSKAQLHFSGRRRSCRRPCPSSTQGHQSDSKKGSSSHGDCLEDYASQSSEAEVSTTVHRKLEREASYSTAASLEQESDSEIGEDSEIDSEMVTSPEPTDADTLTDESRSVDSGSESNYETDDSDGDYEDGIGRCNGESSDDCLIVTPPLKNPQPTMTKTPTSKPLALSNGGQRNATAEGTKKKSNRSSTTAFKTSEGTTSPMTVPVHELSNVSGIGFRKRRDSLTAKYFEEFNAGVFEGALSSVRVEWSKRLLRTAGLTRSSRRRLPGAEME
ncbi:unnamed protein product, partial [Choristocarpus tenellus]